MSTVPDASDLQAAPAVRRDNVVYVWRATCLRSGCPFGAMRQIRRYGASSVFATVLLF